MRNCFYKPISHKDDTDEKDVKLLNQQRFVSDSVTYRCHKIQMSLRELLDNRTRHIRFLSLKDHQTALNV